MSDNPKLFERATHKVMTAGTYIPGHPPAPDYTITIDDGVQTQVTLRDLFAAAYLAGRRGGFGDTTASEAYAAADAMLVERAKGVE